MIYFNFPKIASFLEISDLENLLFSTACSNLRIYSFKARTLLTDPLCGRVSKSMHVKMIPLPQINRTDGSSPGHATSFLRFSKTFQDFSRRCLHL